MKGWGYLKLMATPDSEIDRLIALHRLPWGATKEESVRSLCNKFKKPIPLRGGGDANDADDDTSFCESFTFRATTTMTITVVAMRKSKSSGSSKTVPTVLTAATTANLTTRMHPTQHMSSWRRAYCRVQLRIPTLRRKTTSSTPLHQCYLSLQSLRQLLPILCSSRLTQLTYTLQVPLYRCTGKVRKSGTQATSPKQMCGEVPTG